MNYTVIAYLIYLPVAIVLTWYVAHILFRNSIVYMLDIFNQREEIAEATNSLFRVGFYLLNLGFALFILRIPGGVVDMRDLIETLSYKIGGFCVYLGAMLFLNLFLFFCGKNAARQRRVDAEQFRGRAS